MVAICFVTDSCDRILYRVDNILNIISETGDLKMARSQNSLWRKTTCEKRYIEGEQISMRELAKLSGRNLSTLTRWAVQEKWKERRDQFKAGLKEATYAKAVEKASEKLSDELSDISIANYESHKEMRDYVLDIVKRRRSHLEEIKHLEFGEWTREIKSKHSPVEINHLSIALSRATDGISAAIGLPYHVNINTAYKKLESEGYMVVNPAEDGVSDRAEESITTVDVDAQSSAD
jgi:hypothetical protein